MKAFFANLLFCAALSAQSWYPSIPDTGANSGSALTSICQIDATGEKCAMCGSVWTPNGGAKSIDKVGLMFGSTVTKAGGSALTLSLQDATTASGPPIQPDGTQDQTVAVPNASMAASTFLLSASLSSQRAVTHGAIVCAVTEFDGSGRLGSDSINFSAVPRNSGNPASFPSLVHFTSSWASTNRLPIIVFEFSDGSYGTLDGASPISSYNSTTAINTGTTPDEHSQKFTVPTSGYIDGVGVSLSAVATGADFDIVLYDGTTALNSISVDSNALDGSGSSGLITLAFPKTTVTAGTTYYFAVKPTTANSVSTLSGLVGSAAYWDALPQGQTWIRSHRTDAGAWSDTATARLFLRFRFTPVASAGGTHAFVH